MISSVNTDQIDDSGFDTGLPAENFAVSLAGGLNDIVDGKSMKIDGEGNGINRAYIRISSV